MCAHLRVFFFLPAFLFLRLFRECVSLMKFLSVAVIWSICSDCHLFQCPHKMASNCQHNEMANHMKTFLPFWDQCTHTHTNKKKEEEEEKSLYSCDLLITHCILSRCCIALHGIYFNKIAMQGRINLDSGKYIIYCIYFQQYTRIIIKH